MIIATLEDIKFTNNNIYLTYIDFKNAFGSIDHARFLALMIDLGYPKDMVELIGDIYTNSTTSFHGTLEQPTHLDQERHNSRGHAQPLPLFTIFLYYYYNGLRNMISDIT